MKFVVQRCIVSEYAWSAERSTLNGSPVDLLHRLFGAHVENYSVIYSDRYRGRDFLIGACVFPMR